MGINYLRQLKIIDPRAVGNTPIFVVGAGGIGGPTVFALAKMGFRNITVWDHDTVEDHNLPNQMFRVADLGRPKVEALADIIGDFADVDITAVNARFSKRDAIGKIGTDGIVIAAVDNMATRHDIWRAVSVINPQAYLDCRMGRSVLWLQVVNPSNETHRVRYETSLYSDKDAVQDPCTARAVWYNAIAAGMLIARAVKRLVNGEEVEFEATIDMDSLMLFTA